MPEKQKPDPRWTVISQGSSKAAEALSVVSNAFEVEDEFVNHYHADDKRPIIIQPPYDLKVLERISQENNTLPACIDAMVSNIDGTGYTFEGPEDDRESEDEEDPVVDELENTFSTIGIEQSFITLRRQKRRDEEQTGNAYFEVIRNAKGDIVFIRNVESKMMRLVRLDAAVEVAKSVVRNGETLEVNVSVRERRYAQYVGNKNLVYFRDFGSSRQLNKHTGEWEVPGTPVLGPDRASEILHFKAKPDAHTPYGIPRWISQLPSVLGSRKAEEFNLDFFNNGGIPPAIIFLQGGTLSSETRKAVEDLNIGAAVKKNRLAVLELESTDGSLDKSSATARVTVERFGADRQNDSMFEKYDDKASLRIRRAFRLPPLFLGQADDYNFATSHTSYMVAEQQVFRPEREEFDEIISIRLLPAMGRPGYRLVSKPLVLKNAEILMMGVDKAKDIGGVSKKLLIETVNDAAGTRFEYDEEEDKRQEEREEKLKNPPPFEGQIPGQSGGQNLKVINGGKPSQDTMKQSASVKSEGMYAFAFELRDAIASKKQEEINQHLLTFQGLSAHSQEFVREALSKMMYITSEPDDLGLSELAGCGQMILARETLGDK